MRKSSKLRNWLKLMTGALMLFAVLNVGMEFYSITVHADSAGKVTATSAKIRKEPSTSSETLASVEKDATISITGQIKASDGYTWYQVDDAGQTGYIRSDLISITDGSTPPTVVSSTTTTTTTPSSTPTTSTPDETVVAVNEVEPVSGSVSSGSPVRVRQNASTTSRIVSTAQSGLSLTITGTATGTDGKDWYQVKFTSGSAEISGFIRSDYVTVSGELLPPGTGTGSPEGTEQPEVTEPEPEQTKEWDTFIEGGKWYLQDNNNDYTYDIAKMFASVEDNTNTLNEYAQKNKTQQIIVICLIIVLILLAAVISYLVFRLKDMSDSAYFNEVERETVRRRAADRPSADRDRRPTGQRPTGQRPAGQRPSGAGSSQRPAGQRPSGAGSSQRPAGQRPAGQRPSGAGSGQRPVGQRPAGQRPSGAGSSQRPAGQRPVEQRQSEIDGNGHSITEQRPLDQSPVETRPEYEQESAHGQNLAPEAPAQEKAPAESQKKSGWRSKNFADDDEFEFQFLDWDGDDRK